MTQPPALVPSYITIQHYQVQDVGRHNNELFLLGPWELPRWLSGIEAACQCRRLRFDPWVGKIPLEEETGPSSDFLVCLFHQSSVWPPGEEDHRSCSGVHGGQASLWVESMKTTGFGVGQTWVQIPPLQLSRWVTLYLNHLLICRTSPPIFPYYYHKVQVTYVHYSHFGKRRKIRRGKI